MLTVTKTFICNNVNLILTLLSSKWLPTEYTIIRTFHDNENNINHVDANNNVSLIWKIFPTIPTLFQLLPHINRDKYSRYKPSLTMSHFPTTNPPCSVNLARVCTVSLPSPPHPPIHRTLLAPGKHEAPNIDTLGTLWGITDGTCSKVSSRLSQRFSIFDLRYQII